MRQVLCEALATEMGAAPSDFVIERAEALFTREVWRVYATVLPADRGGRIRQGVLAENHVVAGKLDAEFPWAAGLVERTARDCAAHIGREGPADVQRGRPELALPPLDVAAGLLLGRDLAAPLWGARTGTGAATPPGPAHAELIESRVFTEVGVRLRFLEVRSGRSVDLVEAVADVLHSVVTDSGGDEGLADWARHLAQVDQQLVMLGTARRCRAWSQPTEEEPVPTKVKLDDSFLASHGLGDLTEAERGPLLETYYRRLEGEVGKALSDGLSDEKLSEFEHLVDAGDTAASSSWLDLNRPNYRETVARIHDRVGAELAASAQVLLQMLGREAGERP